MYGHDIIGDSKLTTEGTCTYPLGVLHYLKQHSNEAPVKSKSFSYSFPEKKLLRTLLLLKRKIQTTRNAINNKEIIIIIKQE